MKTHDLPLIDKPTDAWRDLRELRDAHEPPALRDLAALLLRAASRALDRLALSLALPPAAAAAAPTLEFHAEAGAPEGALYVDGRLVGRLEGVTRL